MPYVGIYATRSNHMLVSFPSIDKAMKGSSGRWGFGNAVGWNSEPTLAPHQTPQLKVVFYNQDHMVLIENTEVTPYPVRSTMITAGI